MTRKLLVIGAALAVIGSIGTAISWALNPQLASRSYLFAYATVLSVVLGALFLLMIGHACDALWFVAVRRLAEHAVAPLPLLALLFVPVLASMKLLYPWLRVADLSRADQEVVMKKLAWLNEPFFIARSIAYLASFIVLAEVLRRLSVTQDRTPQAAARLRRRMITVSAVGLPVLALTLTFASFDWLMSLEPAWYSNLYGVYIFAGGFVAALGLFGIMLVLARTRGLLPDGVSVEHYYALGRLDLAMVIFWTYIGYAQLLLYWIADLPLEVTWYIRRWHGGWEWFGGFLLLVHWALPFFSLLLQSAKRRASVLLSISAWLLAAHVLDIYYLIIPAFEPSHFRVHAADFFALAGICGATLAFAAWRAAGVSAHPVHDPLLEESLSYEAV